MTTVCRLIAKILKNKGVSRVYGLCGGHIQPVWDEIADQGITIVDVRDEKAAVHMAQAQAELTGDAGVALVTAGPGMTNAVTGIANASVARAPVVVIAGSPPLPQRGKGALQEVDQVGIVAAITRCARTVLIPGDTAETLEDAFFAARGYFDEPGPAFVDFPTDVLRAAIQSGAADLDCLQAKRPPAGTISPAAVQAAVQLIWSARRPVLVTGRGARGAGREIAALLDALGAVYLDTVESKGLVPGDHPSFMPAMRARAMQEADLIVTLGRSLDYQLAYGSRAVFAAAKFVRIGNSAAEVSKNRPGDAEIFGPVGAALRAVLAASGNRLPQVDSDWTQDLRSEDLKRRNTLEKRMRTAPPGKDGAMHPYRLLGAIRNVLDPDAIVVADGGDILSFARQVFSEWTYLDSGPFGCLGVGLPYGISAALAFPDRQTVVVTGDGACGFNAMELDTCRRHGARVVFVVSNNSGWNIERHDQLVNYQGRLVGVDLSNCDYAALAGSLGVEGERVADPEALPAALAKAFARAPFLLDVVVTRDAPSPDFLAGIAGVPDFQALTRWNDLEAGVLRKDG